MLLAWSVLECLFLLKSIRAIKGMLGSGRKDVVSITCWAYPWSAPILIAQSSTDFMNDLEFDEIFGAGSLTSMSSLVFESCLER